MNSSSKRRGGGTGSAGKMGKAGSNIETSHPETSNPDCDSETAKLYRTARFAPSKLAMAPGLPTTFIRVVFYHEQWNQLRQKAENVFACYSTMDDSSFIGYYFESALTDFCL